MTFRPKVPNRKSTMKYSTVTKLIVCLTAVMLANATPAPAFGVKPNTGSKDIDAVAGIADYI
ncbi:hypothetical protein FPV67DRAFT_1680561 [Lyophyllum atratum]|nr:hypothetical protein FPV67DRAFT_1680561 [Lyophyllum atratum]